MKDKFPKLTSSELINKSIKTNLLMILNKKELEKIGEGNERKIQAQNALNEGLETSEAEHRLVMESIDIEQNAKEVERRKLTEELKTAIRKRAIDDAIKLADSCKIPHLKYLVLSKYIDVFNIKSFKEASILLDQITDNRFGGDELEKQIMLIIVKAPKVLKLDFEKSRKSLKGLGYLANIIREPINEKEMEEIYKMIIIDAIQKIKSMKRLLLI